MIKKQTLHKELTSKKTYFHKIFIGFTVFPRKLQNPFISVSEIQHFVTKSWCFDFFIEKHDNFDPKIGAQRFINDGQFSRSFSEINFQITDAWREKTRLDGKYWVSRGTVDFIMFSHWNLPISQQNRIYCIRNSW